ncbi:ABC-2 transporter permease [Staphylococcus devriesei]|uniref:ABC-2 transporter permease n=1 Tax=Staphylococcus devriesei TaxID=586733 RepID=A0A2K4DUG4_9STAP|nr:ABC-2 transporter permease [Staphylococcus devriesei]MCE5097141.1 ABC-2 transporter permease [Staphylococcus devriesei]PNZ90483.1 ABC-2 transporter permease [Staphylococcus devriesei]PTE74646.1 ABC-2 transporter permease [Staphylococcus devriesei]PTF05001.1 ABC-2 transporter permease [Staphylococcus devriesei]PTF13616.1 ABC-2 transporter permease [Staphylococcus devriesei]
MKGLLLSSFYASKKSLITYLIVGIIASIIFGFVSPMMSCFMPMVMLISPITDNIKREKDSKWMYYVSTLPTHRSTYVKAYFAFYGLLVSIGLIIGVVVCLAVTQNPMMTLLSACIGIGMVGTYALIFPFTFKFGPENSNVIMITTSIIAIVLFFLMWFFVITPILVQSGSFEKMTTNPIVLFAVIGYAVLGLIIFTVSYFASLSIFKKQEL